MTLTPVEQTRMDELDKIKAGRPLTEEEKAELKVLIDKEAKV